MGVYIKNMEMPTSCDDCRFAVDGWCYACVPESAEERRRITTNYCPLIEIPPHGRLIDAEAFSSEMKERQTEAIKWMRESVQNPDAFIRAEATVAFLSEVKLTLDKMPTIIPADPAEEGE